MMAKNEHQEKQRTGLTSGLHFAAAPAETAPERARWEDLNAAEPVMAEYRKQYKEQCARETRSCRTTISLKPSLKCRIDRAVERKEIKSLNDLVNYLLEQYFVD